MKRGDLMSLVEDKLTEEEKALKRYLEAFDYSTVMNFGEIRINVREGKAKVADFKKTVIFEN